MAENDNWLSNVLRTDETHFALPEFIYSHNCGIWATDISRTFVQTPLHDEKVTVGYGFTKSTVIDPFFFNEMRDSSFETVNVIDAR